MKRFLATIRQRSSAACASVAASCLILSLFAANTLGAQRLVGQEQAARLGLTRAWYTQIRLDSARTRIGRAIVRGDRLTVLTTSGIVQELNALTGETYWLAPIGKDKYPSLGPAANDKFVAVINGSTLYVLDRKDGKPAFIQSVGGAPGAAPAISDKYVFVPLVSGKVEGFSLTEQKLTPWSYQSFGSAMVSPLATSESVVWSTDAGYLYVGNCIDLSMRYRLETGSEIGAPPSYHKPYVYVTSLDGEVFSINELTGSHHWKYATGFPITRAAAAVGDHVYVTSGEPALHCIDAKTGSGVWEVPHITQFAAASKDRVYALNDLGTLTVLNSATGATLATIKADRPLHALVNDQTDRVYLVASDGVIECLYETGAKQPTYYNPQPAPQKEKPAVAPPIAPVTKPAASGDKPPAKPKSSTPAAKPKAKETKESKEPAKKDAGNDDNPFG
jgi:outer membrane protein assembly factor BamB